MLNAVNPIHEGFLSGKYPGRFLREFASPTAWQGMTASQIIPRISGPMTTPETETP